MKKIIVIIILVFVMLESQEQNYLINFAGAGATNVIDTVNVNNLTSGATITLNGGDILHLIPAVGIGTRDIYNGTVQVYPNPMAEQARLTFDAPINGNVIISIVDISGKTLFQISTIVSNGVNSFRISGINRGIYFVKITGLNYNYTTKLISQNDLQSETRIEPVSYVENIKSNRLKNITATIDMPYTNGDQLLYKGISGIYSNLITDVPVSSKTVTFNFVLCQDIDGNNYSTVQIGAGKSIVQTWMAENLNVGVRIDSNQQQINDGIIQKFCYHDDVNQCSTYGGLYQWNEAMKYDTTPGIQGICPAGWHLPTAAEWTTLITYMGVDTIAGGNMKETGTIYWLSPNYNATNSSGFTGLPGGEFPGNGGHYYGLTTNAYFWSSSQYNPIPYTAFGYSLGYNYGGIGQANLGKVGSFSIRCIHG
jgi:uncharacterized protein (TIGR02145 family)